MNNYLVEGISGTGKTTVGEKLRERGYRVIDADEVFGYFGDPKTGLPIEEKSQLNWMWNKDKVEQELGDTSEITFVNGGSVNQDKFRHFFSKVFTLHVDDKTMKHRLLNRTNNDFGKNPEDLARQLKYNKGTVIWSQKRETTLIDATKPVDEVVDEILRHIEGSEQKPSQNPPKEVKSEQSNGPESK